MGTMNMDMTHMATTITGMANMGTMNTHMTRMRTASPDMVNRVMASTATTIMADMADTANSGAITTASRLRRARCRPFQPGAWR